MVVMFKFDKSLERDMLSAFNKGVDTDGFIVEQDTGQKVVTPEGDNVHIDEFAGIAPGSEVFIKSDLVSLMKFSKKYREFH